MFERLTDRARKTMARANEEAQRLHSHCIESAHILLGLTKEPQSIAAQALANLGVDLAQVRREVERRVKAGPPMVTMVPHAKKVIEQAIKEARSLNHQYVGTEHLLLGVLGVRDGIAFEVLIALGVQAEAVREKVVELVGPRGMNRLDTGLSSPPEPGDLDPTSFVRFAGEMPLLGERISKLEQAVVWLTEEIRALRRDLEDR